MTEKIVHFACFPIYGIIETILAIVREWLWNATNFFVLESFSLLALIVLKKTIVVYFRTEKLTNKNVLVT